VLPSLRLNNFGAGLLTLLLLHRDNSPAPLCTGTFSRSSPSYLSSFQGCDVTTVALLHTFFFVASGAKSTPVATTVPSSHTYIQEHYRVHLIFTSLGVALDLVLWLSNSSSSPGWRSARKRIFVLR
jgi:hypothetical protein